MEQAGIVISKVGNIGVFVNKVNGCQNLGSTPRTLELQPLWKFGFP